MRTMFIPTILLLFCSLSQLTNAAGRSQIPGCEDVYDCYVPAACRSSSITILDDAALSSKEVGEAKDVDIHDECPAIFRFHAFSDNWVQVSIVSFDATTESVIFRQTEPSNDPSKMREFSCTRTSNGNDVKIEGKYGGKVKPLIDEKIDLERAKLHCTFVIEQSGSVFDHDIGGDRVLLFEIQRKDPATSTSRKVVTGETKYTTYTLHKILRCDPSNLMFTNEDNNEKKYKEVMFKLNSYYCKNSDIYQMQYRPEGKVEYVDISTLHCKGSNFIINKDVSKKIDRSNTIDVRCVADAQFFCDYDPKAHPKEQELLREKAIHASKKPAQLACPDDHKYLFVDGKLFQNPEFKCLNFDGVEYWTVTQKQVDAGHNGNSYQLTQSGPETYCAKTINCILKYKIPDSAVKQGTLDGENLPICFDEGVLHVGEDKNITVRCDNQTGDFKYKANNVEYIVDEKTEFKCEYPDKEDKEQNHRNDILLMAVGGAGIGICILLVIVIVIIVVWRSKKHIEDMNMRHRKEAVEKYRREELAYKHFAYTKGEKKKMKASEAEKEDGVEEQANNENPEEAPQSAPCADPTLWGDLVMDFICKSEEISSVNIPRLYATATSSHLTEGPEAQPEKTQDAQNRVYESDRKVDNQTENITLSENTIDCTNVFTDLYTMNKNKKEE